MTDWTPRHHAREEPPLRVDVLTDPTVTGAAMNDVFDLLLGRYAGPRVLDGDRSVVIPSRGTPGSGGVKIKGAGHRGGEVRLGEPHAKPYALPRYDAEGAATVDAAKDHGRAVAGGMSYQQARQELVVSRYLEQAGMRVPRALGYGVVRRGTESSWFCLLETHFGEHRDWWQLTRRRSEVERIAIAFGETQRQLATHDVYLALSGLMVVGDDLVRKDFHTAHIAGPNDTFLTRLAYFLFDTNFILAQFAFDRHMPDIADHRELARRTYLRALAGHDFSPPQIDAFKSLLVELKFADWPLEERISRLAGDTIGSVLLHEFADGSGERELLGTMEPLSEAAVRAGGEALGRIQAPQPVGGRRFAAALRRRQPT